MNKAIEKEYKDPRWLTFIQAKENGYSVKKHERGTLCEKWIFSRELNVKDEFGNEEKQNVFLDKPMVNFFTVFNGEQLDGIETYEPPTLVDNEFTNLANIFIKSSECQVLELAHTKAAYYPGQDKIILPLREYFKDQETFLKTLLHELSHSTGHNKRLNRDLCHNFFSEGYAREELRAELGSIFIESDLGINLQAEHIQDHTNYLISWIAILRKDPNELFRACVDADAISDRVITNYLATKDKELTRRIEQMRPYTHAKVKYKYL